jgi:hypothetical protein
MYKRFINIVWQEGPYEEYIDYFINTTAVYSSSAVPRVFGGPLVGLGSDVDSRMVQGPIWLVQGPPGPGTAAAGLYTSYRELLIMIWCSLRWISIPGYTYHFLQFRLGLEYQMCPAPKVRAWRGFKV